MSVGRSKLDQETVGEHVPDPKLGQSSEGDLERSKGIPSCRARRGLKRLMLREDYVEDKLRFKLRKYTGVVLI